MKFVPLFTVSSASPYFLPVVSAPWFMTGFILLSSGLLYKCCSIVEVLVAELGRDRSMHLNWQQVEIIDIMCAVHDSVACHVTRFLVLGELFYDVSPTFYQWI
jgi:hypothetical protein